MRFLAKKEGIGIVLVDGMKVYKENRGTAPLIVNFGGKWR